MMKQTYRVVGIRSMDGYKMLELQPIDDMVSEKKDVNAVDVLKNLNSFTRDTVKNFRKYQVFDKIRITDDEFVNRDIGIDSMFSIDF